MFERMELIPYKNRKNGIILSPKQKRLADISVYKKRKYLWSKKLNLDVHQKINAKACVELEARDIKNMYRDLSGPLPHTETAKQRSYERELKELPSLAGNDLLYSENTPAIVHEEYTKRVNEIMEKLIPLKKENDRKKILVRKERKSIRHTLGQLCRTIDF